MTSTFARVSGLKSICIAALCLGAAASQAQTAPMSHAPAAGSADMKQTMMAGMESMQKMQASGDTDKDFAMMMKMHHQQALEMAEMELKHGKSAEMKAMAKRIIAAQKKEIAEFDHWLAKHK